MEQLPIYKVSNLNMLDVKGEHGLETLGKQHLSHEYLCYVGFKT